MDRRRGVCDVHCGTKFGTKRAGEAHVVDDLPVIRARHAHVLIDCLAGNARVSSGGEGLIK